MYVEWAMGGVGGDVAEEWGFIRLHKLHGFVEPYVCAITGVRFGCAVSEICCGEVVVVPVVWDFSNYAAAKAQGFTKSPIKGAIGIVVAQMPFAKDAGAIARVRKCVGDGDFIPAHDIPAPQSAPYAGARGISPGHECGSRGRAHGIYVIVGQAHALVV